MEIVDTLKACLDIYTRMMPNIRVNADVTHAAANTGFQNATDLADYLVAKGMAFRQAHACVGKAVAYALDCGKELHELGLSELQQFDLNIDKDVYEAMSVDRMIARRKVYGGTAGDNVSAAIARARKQLVNAASEIPGV
jgi:argininosuccinate lyase